MNRARIPDGLLAALALLVASWPLTTLLTPSSWVRPAVLLVLLAAVLGMAGRAAGLRGFVVFAGQLVIMVLALVWIFLADHLWYGLPTRDTLGDAQALVEQTVHTIRHFAAPAPTGPGIIFVVAASLGLLAVVIDYLAVTRRSPALTGLPLLVVFLVSAANSGSSLNPVYFLALAFMWLILLARQGSSLLSRWASTDATPATPTRDLDDARGLAGHASMARALGVTTLVVALAVPAFLPHLPPHYFADGLGRSSSGSGGNGTVGFTQTLDLTADLASTDTTPVVTYRTNDPLPPPLRVTTTSEYDGQRWQPEPRAVDDIASSSSPDVRNPVGLTAGEPKTKYRIKVTSNRLNAPQLAAPSPVAGADLDGVKWGLTPDDRSVLVDRRPDRYTVTFWQIGRKIHAENFADDPTRLAGVTPADLQVDPQSKDRVTALAQRVVGDAAAPLGKAIRIQDYLRDSSRFTYSLTLAKPREDANGDRLDPISHFLVTKQGYCTQFATAMVMMARSQGIPARMAIGFLPGSDDGNGLYTVTESDAHAWPELYLPGLGWTRFEPTPSVRSGEPPDYAERTPTGAVAGGRPVDAQPNPQATQPGAPKRDITARQEFDTAAVPPPTTATDPAWRDWLPWGAGLVLLLGGLVLPLAGSYRRRRLAGTGDPVEAQWASFAARMSDYGVTTPHGRTPRQLQRYYLQHTDLDEQAREAMQRALQTLERSRYAVPTDTPLSIGADTREVLRDVTSTRSWSARLRALLWPNSGREQLRLWWRSLLAWFGGPARAVGDRVDSWEDQQRRRRQAARDRRH